jgi:hypothetical protein
MSSHQLFTAETLMDEIFKKTRGAGIRGVINSWQSAPNYQLLTTSY